MPDGGAPAAIWQPKEPVVPKSVRGPIRTAKWIVLGLLLVIYYGAPWLRWDRGPHAPDQAILIDLPARRAFFFFFEIWPQEIYVVTGILILMAIGLFFVTALAGRVWCGWACPQTVWTDLYLAVERLVEGDRARRLRLLASPWSLGRIARHAVKHAIWLVIAALTGGAWVLYFNDAPTVTAEILRLEAGYPVWATIGLLTFSTYLLAGWARENVCTFMCPYARFQSAMLDQDSLIVAYRAHRGEPRGKHKAGEAWDGRGHCIDCRQCVEVCPTGIDIRDGLQMSCIQCGLCVDACNNIMARVGLPKGLVGFATQANLEAEAAGRKPVWHWLRARTVLYGVIYATAGLALLGVLLFRSPLELTVLPDRNPLFVRLSDGAIRNGYTVRILNKTNEPQSVAVTVEGIEGAHLSLLEAPAGSVALRPDAAATLRAFVTVPKGAYRGPGEIGFVVADPSRGLARRQTVRFEGPPR
ncbi:MAG: cytochrome c oxidase accessory protein CcoG [Thalassobaculales bacterium]